MFKNKKVLIEEVIKRKQEGIREEKLNQQQQAAASTRPSPSCTATVNMRLIKTVKTLAIPKDVKVTIKSRFVRVKGPRGVLTRDFGHQQIDLILESTPKGQVIRAELWNGDRKTIACIRTVISHIKNMVTGVTKGFLFKMKMVYAHFPISVNIENSGKRVEVRNFLGEKLVRVVELAGDTTAKRSEDGTKDEITLSGSSVDALSQSCANIQQSCRVKDKDIRKFLDGIYVSYKGHVVQEE